MPQGLTILSLEGNTFCLPACQAVPNSDCRALACRGDSCWVATGAWHFSKHSHEWPLQGTVPHLGRLSLYFAERVLQPAVLTSCGKGQLCTLITSPPKQDLAPTLPHLLR